MSAVFPNDQRNRGIRSAFGAASADAWIAAYADWVVRWRWFVIAALLAVGAAAGTGAARIEFSTDYRVFFGPENPQLRAYTAIQNSYIKENNLLLVLAPDDGDVFSPAMLDAMRALTEAAWKVPFSTRVDSITNFQHSAARNDDIVVESLVPKSGPVTPEMAARVRGIALAEPLLAGRLVSKDGAAAGINVILTLPEKSIEEVPQAMAYTRALVRRFRADHPGVRVALTGDVALNYAFVEASLADLSMLIPLMYAAIILGVALSLRSLTGTLTTVSVIGLSAATAMGMAGWMGYLINPASAAAPLVITTVAVADSVHILVTTLRELRRGAYLQTAITEGLRINFAPVFLTSLTTIIGFLSLNASDAPPLRDLGNISAIGVAAAWLYAVMLTPAMLAVMPVRPRRVSTGATRAMVRLARFVIAQRRLLLWGTTLVTIVLAAGIPRIELNDQFVNYFSPNIPFRSDTDFAMKTLSGMYTMDFSLDAGGPGRIADPDYLKRLDAFVAWLRQQPGVQHVQSLTDILKRLNRNMHGDVPGHYRLPGNRELAAQYLLLFEMSLPYGLDLKNQINVDRSATRVVATLENVTTSKARRLMRNAEDWLARNLPTRERAEATGPLVMFSHISERNIRSMLVGTAIALLLISLCLICTLRSVRLGLISLIPNATPAFISFGIWGYGVGQVGLSASVVTAATLGIIVDNTVHFLSKYQRAQRERGATPEEAIRYAFSTVGTAIRVTSVILIVGFLILSLSAFQVNQTFGLLTALIVFVALLTDLFLLPPLLNLIDMEKKSGTKAPVAGVSKQWVQ